MIDLQVLSFSALGFYQDSSDNKGYLYHALLVVGYGIDGERAYYVIKNRLDKCNMIFRKL